MTIEVGFGADGGDGSARGGVLAFYREMRTLGALKPDSAQEEIIAALHALGERLEAYRPMPVADGFGGWLDRLRFGQRVVSPPRGLYIWGDVGRGKSMLMDLFHQTLSTHAKCRVHFHVFMREVHERLHMLRRQPHTFAKADMGDPLVEVARLIAHDLWVLCLDELEVQDIGDAMIVGRLFSALTERGVVVVTSNRPPKDLYKDGLQREKFLPFIDLILSRLDVLHLAATRDYRLGRLREGRLYLAPLGPAAEAGLDRLFRDLAGSVAWFGFADLCEAALGATDYMEIAARYQGGGDRGDSANDRGHGVGGAAVRDLGRCVL